MQICAECGMPVEKATTYHPYAACLMFKSCQSSDVVQANLDAVVFHGVEPLSKDAMRYRWLRENPTWIGYAADYRPDEVDAAINEAMKTPNDEVSGRAA